MIASGGAGEARHLAEAFEVGAEAALIASIVHERPERLPELKAELEEAGWPIRTLTPVIVQDAETERVLMLAYADEEALRRTRESGEAWFWSRSRRELWHKGATSGNTLAVEEIRDDCDGDALLYRVRPERARRATPAPSRASRRGCGGSSRSGRATRPEGSYVAGLLDGGPAAAARKVGEEGVEAALAAVAESRRAARRGARRPLVPQLRPARGARARSRPRSRTSSGAGIPAS